MYISKQMKAKNAVIVGRVLLAWVLIVIRWAVFEPLYFIFLTLATIGESGITAITNYTIWAKIENDKILNNAPDSKT